YVLNAPVTATATIDQRALTVSGITASDKVYDGKTTASLVSSDQAVLGVVSGESVTVKAVGAFADKNVGTDKNVALSYQLTGA
ncbi:YDG domain-containing protein, partial [Acinetobacter baumannii]